MPRPDLASARAALERDATGKPVRPDEAPAKSDLHGKSDEKRKRKPARDSVVDDAEEAALDEALEETFPASDPPASSQPIGKGPAGDPATKP